MKDKFYNNADSFAMSFDEEWEKLSCHDIKMKIEKIIDILSEHPFVISNPLQAKNIAEFRIYSLKKFQKF